MHTLHHQNSMHMTAQSHFGNQISYQLIGNTFEIQGIVAIA